MKLQATIAAGLLAAGLGVCTACVHLAPAPMERDFLWTASKDGKTHHLLGTIHVGVDAEAELGPQVWEGFRTSSCFVMESDQSAIDSRELLRMARQPEGQSLRAKLKPETWDRLVARLGRVLPPETLDGSEAWFAGILYLQALVPKGKAMDMVLLAKAEASGKRVAFLEDWREAILAFAKVTDATDLDGIAADEDQALADIQAMTSAYRTGDEREVKKATDRALEHGSYGADDERVLLTERNALWVPRLTKLLEAESSCFVAVGLAHLTGETNVRDSLRDNGYAVTRVVDEAVP